MAARELIHRTGVPTVQHEQPLAHVGRDARTVQLSDRGSIDKRTSPTELFVTSISLRRIRAKRAASEAASSAALTQLTVDHAKLMFSPDELFGVLNGFWWASSEELAAGFWVREYHPPPGYEVVSTDTVRIPRLLLEATRTSQQIGRARVYISLFALAGMTIDRRGRHAAYASYIRASSPEMALRLWQTTENGFPSSERGLAFAFQVSSHWIKGVLDSPPIWEALEHDRVLRRRS